MSALRMLAAVLGYAALVWVLSAEAIPKVAALVMVLFAIVAALVGCRWRPARVPRWVGGAAALGLAAVVAWEWLLLLRAGLAAPWPGPVPGGRTWERLLEGLAGRPAILTSLALIGTVSLSYLWRGMPLARWRFAIVLALFAHLGACTIHRPKPVIDVLVHEDDACAALLRGKNPYSELYPSPYSDLSGYPAAFVREGKLALYWYPPLSIVVALPGYLAGDVRWSMVVALLAAAYLMVAAGRRLGLAPGDPAELGGVAFLLHPAGLYVLQHGWAEPLLAVCGAAAASAAAAGRPRLLALALGCLATVKQTGGLALAPFAQAGRLQWRDAVRGATPPLLLLGVFWLWDPVALWRGLITFHAQSALRFDSLAVPALIWTETGVQTPMVLPFLAAATVTAVVLAAPGLTLSQACLGNAAVCLAFFAFSKAGLVNYYWWASSFFPLAVVAAAGERARAARSAGSDG